MADLTITAASVIQTSGAKPSRGVLAGTSSAGAPIYVNSSGQLALCKADTSAHANCAGILLNGGGAGQFVNYQTNGTITIGGTMVLGGVYVVSSANAGGIAPYADLGTGAFVQILGTATTTTSMTIINKGSNPPTAHA